MLRYVPERFRAHGTLFLEGLVVKSGFEGYHGIIPEQREVEVTCT